MSDSEEDFASADEGENTERGHRTRKNSGRSKKSGSSTTSPPKSATTDRKDEEVKAPIEVDSVSGSEVVDVVLNEPQSQDILDEKNESRELTPTRNVERMKDESQPLVDSEAACNTDGGWTSSFGNWGSAFLSTATKSMSTLTHSVEDGFQTVLDTVEATLAVPSPEEMAAQQAADAAKEHDAVEEEEKEGEEKTDEKGGGSTVGSWLGWGAEGFSNITHKVQETSKTFVHGSLDVLEAIGKKTVDALKEGDPGFQKTKTMMHSGRNKPVLSEVLREAKETAEKNAEAEKEFEESRKANFSAQFDDAQGLVHLEALEMLSNESESKVQSLLSTMSADVLEKLKTELIQIKDHFEIDEVDDEEETDDHDFVNLITNHLSDLHIEASPDKLLKSQSDGRTQIETCSNLTDGKDIHQHAIQSLALITSRSVEQFHKAGELILLRKNPTTDFKVRAQTISDLTKVMCSEVGIISSKYTEILNSIIENAEDKDSINQYITNIYLEATNSSTYIQDAFQLLLPVLQLAAIEIQSET
ncbi:protein FAM114A2-like [Tubulanus polymorphus]|uniref:protein FAM114A2-like n=1 Tax=Tubulanus polymorphus TaxID=672921 RepID=UPI003DA29891